MNCNVMSVSVVVPVYNAEKTLKRCLDSILNQSISPDEIILVDDGSTDSSPVICDEYVDKHKNCYVIHKPNEGVSKARNCGIKSVQSHYFVCIDSDDYVENTYIACLLEAARNHPECDHIWCGFKTVHEDGSTISMHVIDEDSLYSIFNRKDYMELSVKWFTQMPWHRLYKTSLVHSKGIMMLEDLSLGEDIIFNLQYLDATDSSEIVFVNLPLYNYVQFSSQSLNHKYRDNLHEINTRIDSSTKEYLQKWNVGKEGMELFYNQSFYRYEHIFENTFSPQNNMSLRKKIRFINNILETNQFQEILQNRTCQVNALIEKAYRIRRFEIVLVVQKLSKLKNNLFKNH